MRTRFAVVMPTYNRAQFLARSIGSVLRQTFGNFELIVVDDGSTDNTHMVVQGYQDPRLRYLYQTNAGAAAARNLGVAMATAKYIVFLDSDDEVLPEWLATFASSFQHDNIGIVCCGGIKVEEKGKAVVEALSLPYNHGPIYHYQTLMFLAGAFAVRRKLFEDVGGYTATRTAGQHSELARRIIPHCLAQGLKIESVQTPLVRWYLHSGARIRNNPAALLQATQDWLCEYGETYLQKSPRAYAAYCNVGGVAAFRLGRYTDARRFFWRSLVAYPRDWRHYLRLTVSMVPILGHYVWAKHADM